MQFSGWYTKRELGARLGILFCGAMLSGAFAGLFAAGIAAAFEHNRIASWRWLFIIEGAATVVVAVASMFVIPDWPSTTTWLSEEERQLGIIRLIEDAGEEDEEISPWQGFVMAMKDGKLWLAVTGQVCVQVSDYKKIFDRYHILKGFLGCRLLDQLPPDLGISVWVWQHPHASAHGTSLHSCSGHLRWQHFLVGQK